MTLSDASVGAARRKTLMKNLHTLEKIRIKKRSPLLVKLLA